LFSSLYLIFLPLLESLLEESRPVETGLNIRGFPPDDVKSLRECCAAAPLQSGFAAEGRAAAALDLAAATKRPSASKSDAAEQFGLMSETLFWDLFFSEEWCRRG
jgi:hypothetical protein